MLTRAQTRLIREREARAAAQALRMEAMDDGQQGAAAANEEVDMVVGFEFLLQHMANLPVPQQHHIIVQAMQNVGFEPVFNGPQEAPGGQEEIGPELEQYDAPLIQQNPPGGMQNPPVEQHNPPVEQQHPPFQHVPPFQQDPHPQQQNINDAQQQVPNVAPNMAAPGPNIQAQLPPGYVVAPGAQFAGFLQHGQQPGVLFEPNADEQAVLGMQHGHQGPMLLEGAHLMGLPLGPNGEANENNNVHEMANIMQEINAEIQMANAGGGEAQPVGLGGHGGNGVGLNGHPGPGAHVHPVNNGGLGGGIQNAAGIPPNLNDLMATPPQHQNNNNNGGGGHAYPPTPHGPNRQLRLLEEKLERQRVLTATEEQKTQEQANKRTTAEHKQAETILVGQTEFYHWRISYHVLLAWLRYQHLFGLFHVHIGPNGYAFDVQGGGAQAGNGGGFGGGVQEGPGIPGEAGNGAGGGAQAANGPDGDHVGGAQENVA